MKTLTVITILLIFLSIQSYASDKLTYLYDSNYTFHVSAGVAYYHDHKPYQYDINYQEKSIDTMAIYVQTPIASMYNIDFCIGGISPIGYVERSRPEFSLNKIISKNIEIGLAWLASPYQAFSLLFGYRF